MADYPLYQTVRSIGVKKETIFHIIGSVLRARRETSAVSVHFIGDRRMRTLNTRYRGKPKTTDVLAFSAREGGNFPTEGDIGDIFISVPQIERQARRFDVPYEEELTRMLVHGLLHLLGFDHEQPRDAKKMFGLQERFVKEFCS